MRNIALFLRYLGTAYHGWQVQKDLPTVAATLEKAAAMVVGQCVIAWIAALLVHTVGLLCGVM